MCWKITTECSHAERLDADADIAPALRRAYEAWQAQRGASAMPEWRTAQLLAYPRELLPWAVAARVEPDGESFRVLYWGSSRSRLQHVDYTGRLVTEYQPPLIGAKVQRECAEVRRLGQPLLFRSIVEGPIPGRREYYKIRLPYRGAADGGGAVVLSLDDPDQIERRLYLAWQNGRPTEASD